MKNKMLADRVLIVACLSAVLGLTGCQQEEGPAETAGKKIDESTDASKGAIGKVDQATESVMDKAQLTGKYIDDSVITTKVKAAILNDPLLNASHIEVTTNNGVVKLSGTVDSAESVVKAMEVAHSQENVKSVQSDLTVNASTTSQ